MKKLKLWFKENVLKTDYFTYRVYYKIILDSNDYPKTIYLDFFTNSKANAKKSANEYLEAHAKGFRYSFIKVEKVG